MKVRSRVLSSRPRGRAWEVEPGRHAGGASPPWRAGWFCCWSPAPPLPLEYSATSPSPGTVTIGQRVLGAALALPRAGGERVHVGVHGPGPRGCSAWGRPRWLGAAWLLPSLGGSSPVKHMPLAPGSVSRALRPGALWGRCVLLPWPEKVGSLLRKVAQGSTRSNARNPVGLRGCCTREGRALCALHAPHPGRAGTPTRGVRQCRLRLKNSQKQK